MNAIDTSEVIDYIKSLTDSISKSLEESGFMLADDIVIELSIINSKQPNGQIKLLVAKPEEHHDKDQLSKLRIPIRKQYSELTELVGGR